MTVEQVMAELKALGNEQSRKINAKNGATDNQFGVKMGELRNVAKKIKGDSGLVMALWNTGNYDAMLLATLLMKPKDYSAGQIDQMVRSVPHRKGAFMSQLAGWLSDYVVKQHPDKEALRVQWMQDKHPMAARTGWSLTAERVKKDTSGLDIKALLDRIERDMGGAPPEVQWTMNFTLAEIGINHPEYRERAIAIGEKLGIYRDYPVSKGCVSPFAPIWITEMANRQG